MDYFSDYRRSKEYTFLYNKNWKSPEYTQYKFRIYSQGEYFLLHCEDKYYGDLLVAENYCILHNTRGPALVIYNRLNKVQFYFYYINGEKR